MAPTQAGASMRLAAIKGFMKKVMDFRLCRLQSVYTINFQAKSIYRLDNQRGGQAGLALSWLAVKKSDSLGRSCPASEGVCLGRHQLASRF
jgi:hypothetical protein